MSNNPKGAGPLWIISLFLTLTETVAGIAATQVSGGIQIAFTAFAVAFPVLVAAAFFYILWNRPEVLYPPDEKTSVVQFIKAQKEARSQFSASEVQLSNMITEKRGELERALTEAKNENERQDAFGEIRDILGKLKIPRESVNLDNAIRKLRDTVAEMHESRKIHHAAKAMGIK